MVGDWHIPEISLYSTSTIPVLKKFEIPTTTGFEYKSLGLLANGDNVYYLIDWKTEYYYMQKPNIYIIPRSDDLVLNFIVAPYRNPTKTPLPTSTLAATATPSPTLTITPTP
jgi:hypothetical protein